ncbi:MAG: hypothetical protein FGM24_06205 [Candidatus Kapabacteria bacterium]|nr:hypothetical protein [Candidatus Kapabacteria bacterium]
MRCCLTILLSCCCITAAGAQTPDVLRHVTRLTSGGLPIDGAHQVTVRWYDVPVGGTPTLVERHNVVATLGIVELRLGETVGIDNALLDRGTVWLGYSIDGGAEESVRERLLSAPFARLANRAAIADRLSPQVTGIVTSINEMAGAVRILGDSTIDVQRTGDVLRLGMTRPAAAESGSIGGDATTWRFAIRIATPLSDVANVTLRVDADTETVIGAAIVDMDTTTNTITVATTAILTPAESLHWSIHRK